MKTIIVFIILLSSVIFTQDNPLNKLSFLVENDWAETGKWLRSGREFNQKAEGRWGLNGKIIKLKVEGIVNMETGERGHRNDVVIAYDSYNDKIMYYSFDVYGGVVEAEVVIGDDKIHIKYQVSIQNKLTSFRDTWIKVNESTFDYEIYMIGDNGEEKILEGKVSKIN